MSKYAIPAPAMIDGVEWQVRDSGGPDKDGRHKAFVDFSTKTMVVPLDGSPTGDLIRNHETAHVAITPRDETLFRRLAKEFPNRTLQAVEDCRVYCALQRAGINTDAGHWPDADIAGIAALGDSPEYREEKARALIATRGTADHDKFRKILPEDIVAETDALFGKHFQPFIDKGELPPFEAAIAMAREIHAEIGDATPPPEGDDGDEGDGKGEGEGGGSGGSKGEDPRGAKDIARPFKPGDVENTAPQEKITTESLTSSEREMMEDTLGSAGASYVGGYDGGTFLPDENVTISYPRLTVRQTGKGLGQKSVCSDNGAIPRRLNRYAVDSAVFSRKIKGGYATVLVDCSGSMAFTPEDIAHILDSLPHCTVAMYSGRRNSGEIAVVAKDGKRVAEIPMPHGGNVCDYQGLKWLARQRGPRFWICDGIVTGQDDRILSVASALALTRVAQLANVKRFRSIDNLLDGLKEKKSVSYSD